MAHRFKAAALSTSAPWSSPLRLAMYLSFSERLWMLKSFEMSARGRNSLLRSGTEALVFGSSAESCSPTRGYIYETGDRAPLDARYWCTKSRSSSSSELRLSGSGLFWRILAFRHLKDYVTTMAKTIIPPAVTFASKPQRAFSFKVLSS